MSTARLHSNAVMASRLTADSLQLFPTPPWATRAPIEQELLPRGWLRRGMSMWDPCCGLGHMVMPLRDYSNQVFASDVHDWGFGDRHGLDFTFARREDAPWPVDWIFANPPFTLAEEFLDKALQLAGVGVALFVRLQWLEGGERYGTVWTGDRRPTIICPFSERVPIIEGVWDPEASSATAYMWCIWVKGAERPIWPICHIAPGASARYARLADLDLAMPGEAARRKKSAQDAELGRERGGGVAVRGAVDVAPAGLLARDAVVDAERRDGELPLFGQELSADRAQRITVDLDAADLRRDRKAAQRLDDCRAIAGDGRSGEEAEREDEHGTHEPHLNGAEA